MVSIFHHVIKFATPKGEDTLYEDQVEGKQCYLTTVSTKVAIKKVQLIEEE